MWLFRTGEDGLPPIILFKYTETRAKFNAEEFLKGFKGYLETDGYQGYNNLPDIRRCCWAHLPRYFVEAVPKRKELDYSNPVARQYSTVTDCLNMNASPWKKGILLNKGKNTGFKKKNLCWMLSGHGSHSRLPKKDTL